MPETVFVHIGGCGVRLGDAYWRQLASEREQLAADAPSLSSVVVDESTHFLETCSGRWRPRAVFADFENGTADSIRGSLEGDHGVDPSDFVSCPGTSGGQWGRGHYADGAEAVGAVLDRIGKHIEACDSLSHVHLTGGLAGGAGGGLGSLLASKLYEDYRYRDMYQSAVVPNFLPLETSSDERDNTAVFNVMLAMQITEYVTALQFRHNEPGVEASQHDMESGGGGGGRGYAAVNRRIARELAAMEALNRYDTAATDGPHVAPGGLIRSLIPYPRLMFLAPTRYSLPSGANVTPRDTAAAIFATTGPTMPHGVGDTDEERQAAVRRRTRWPGRGKKKDKTAEAAEAAAYEAEYHRAQECLFGVASIYRYNGCQGGGVAPPSSSSIQQQAATLWNAARPPMHSHAAHVYSVISSCVADNSAGDASVTTLLNRPANVAFLKRLGREFRPRFTRRVGLHWYTGVGMDEMEFTEAESRVDDLVSDYSLQYMAPCFSSDSDEDED